MKNYYLILLVLLVFVWSTNAQDFEWAMSFGDSSYDGGKAITADDSGYVYVAGFFRNTVDFDPGAGTTNLTSVGNTDIFVQKLDSSGNLIWAKSFGGSSSDEAYSITVDTSGNVYILGYFQGTVDFDPGAATFNLSATGGLDVFIQKLDASGNFIWAKSFGGSSNDYGYSITVDASGNVYTTGYFYGTADFDPGEGTTNLTSAGSADFFIQKLDTSGDFQWAKSFGGLYIDKGFSITLDDSGNVFTTGNFESTVDFDPGEGITNLSSAGSKDVFIQKLDASGNFLWAKSFGGSTIDKGQSIKIDTSGNIYTAGCFYGTSDFDPGEGTTNLTTSGDSDVFVQKLDASGNFLWVKSLGGSFEDFGQALTLDDIGNVYTMGYFGGTVDFDPGSGTTILVSVGESDVFIQKLDASGNFLWAKTFGGSDVDEGQSLKVDASGNVYSTGFFNGTADFDPGVETTNLNSAGASDIFIQKLSQSSLGVDEMNFGNDITLYPNPFSKNVVIDLSNIKDANIKVYDISGKLMYSNNQVNASQLQFSPSNLNKGIYIVKVESNQHQKTFKLIKQ